MKIQVLRRLLEANDATADDIRGRLDQRGIVLFNLMGSAGCGKTTLLEATLPRLRSEMRCAVLEGDLATNRDAERIARLEVPVIQLLTEGGCHLEAGLVDRGLQKLPLDEVDCIFVENVGNLVCPANFILGEDARVAILSVAEGDDKPLKYPFMFQRCDVVVLTKCDLLPACPFDMDRVKEDLRCINPEITIFETSAPQKRGLEPWLKWLRTSWQERTAQGQAGNAGD